MTKRTNRRQPAISRAQAKKRQNHRNGSKPFIEHLRELRTRVVLIALAILGGSAAAYPLRQTIIDFLVAPAGNQQFIFTSPAGALDFVFKVCLAAGVTTAIPVIIFHLLRYLQPLVPRATIKTALLGMIFSVFLAILGMAFAYTFGLPAALNFLLQTFLTGPVEAMITIQSYMSFVLMYMLGAALIFQVPLVLLFINKIKPLKPKKLFSQQRWVVLVSFIVAALITPTPDIPSLLVLAVPMIAMYQLGIILVWISNRGQDKKHFIGDLLEQDKQLQAERLAEFQKARTDFTTMVRSRQDPGQQLSRGKYL